MNPKLDNRRVKKATPKQLIQQGFYLHYASMWGPLRASKGFRKQNKNWIPIILKRWYKEYGLNALLIIMIILAGTLITKQVTPTLIITAITIAPALTILQMFIDNYARRNITIIHDTETNTGMTIRKTSQHSYAFYNHYALPIGAKNGKHIRDHVHAQMETSRNNLDCTAQNQTVATHYLTEKPSGKHLGGNRPQLTWEYSGKPTPNSTETILSRLLGLNSTRNSGQMPTR